MSTPLATLPDAIYSWWVHPLAVNDGAVAWVGSIDTSGANHVARVTVADGTVTTVDLAGPPNRDEHNGVAIAFNPDQDNLVVFYARHDDDTHVRYQTLNRTTLVTGTQQQLTFPAGCTYAQALVHGNQIVLLTRSPVDMWRYRVSPDWGATWGPAQTLIDADTGNWGQFYVIARPDVDDPSIVHCATQGHPVNSSWRPVGYFRINLATGAITTADGTMLGGLGDAGGPALEPTDLERAVDPGGGDKCRVLDIGTVDGQPAIGFAIWNGDLGPPSYQVTRWDGAEWSPGSWSLASGEPFGFTPETRYLGGLAFGRAGQLYTSRQASGTWFVEQWQRSGQDYVQVAEIARSQTRLIRPYVPLGGGGLEFLYQLVRHYDGFGDYEGDLLLRAFSTPPDPSPPSPEPVAQAVIRNRVTWLGCRLGDGQIIAELPDITGAVSRVLGRYTSASLSIPIPLGGPGAVPLPTILQATEPARTLIVAVVNDVPTWAGIPLPRQRGTGAEVAIGCVSVEGYLQHRFVRDHTWTQQDEASVIAAGLLRDAGDLADVGAGIGLIVDAPSTGQLRDRMYLASDHRTVYDALTELMAVQDGPEWTIDLDWTDGTHTAVSLIARVRPRVGVGATSPTAIFETTAESVFASQGGSDAVYELTEDRSGDLYGNYVIAYASGEGEDQPQSEPAIDTGALAAGAPIWERHYQPSTSITSVGTLNRHAAAELARIRTGATVLAVTARWSTYPRYGVDWALGDDIGWQLVGHGHPDGFTGQGRAVGFVLDTAAGTIQPLLQEEG